ncbi:hypothetical protein [Paenibacillus sp. p3-SID867]|uniref:hypothetical protein n=1 Tax=Paenibacillus sp. p3-SID867 TaxID=2916363 RepID=UPI0037C6E8F1
MNQRDYFCQFPLSGGFLGQIPYLAFAPEAAQADLPVYFSAVRIYDSGIGIKLQVTAGHIGRVT